MLDPSLFRIIETQAERLERIASELFADHTLVLASNRGPIEYTVTERGIEGQRGSGGLVTAMSAVARYVQPRWIAAAMSEGDRTMVAQAGSTALRWENETTQYDLRFVTVDQATYDAYYGTISNPLLWFLQHYMWDAPRTPSIDQSIWNAWQAYKDVNAEFARLIAEEAQLAASTPIIMLHDYHLYCCPAELRQQQLPEGTLLSFFLHIPWPGPDYWSLLPHQMRLEIIYSLVQCDILGFQTQRYLNNFLNTCLLYLPDVDIDYKQRCLRFEGHETLLRAYPISIDIRSVIDLANSPEVLGYRQRLRPYTGDQTIVRIDRVEPSKNIVRGFKAFELLLERYPDYIGRVKFVAVLVPSRLSVEEYQRYLEEIMVVAGWINTRYGNEEWQPVDLVVGENYARAIAAMQLYDVLLVNPIIDGMNLVAKEGVTVNERGGVLVLSEGAGAAEQLSEHALVVSPSDIVGTMEALHQALAMAPTERHERAEALRDAVIRADLSMWLAHQFFDLQQRVQTHTQAHAVGDGQPSAEELHPS